ncbi:hypothetical protein C8Q77DRAFT_169204 [Trametes polyzona]|nr:hypothetical protein C8Q77DRAFT_169204 [Trametes polyzona]
MLIERPSLGGLPDEILEVVLVICAAEGHPESIASLAATASRFFHAIYRSYDHHLWRSVFLTLFDDPRAVRYPCTESIAWERDTKTRIWAGRYIVKYNPGPVLKVLGSHSLRSRDVTLYTVEQPHSKDVLTPLRALNTIVTIIRTLAPDARSLSKTPFHTQHMHTSSHLSTGGSENLVQLHARTGSWPPNVAHTDEASPSVTWLRTLFAANTPPMLASRFSGGSRDGAPRDTPTSLAASQILSYLGFFPACSDIPSQPASRDDARCPAEALQRVFNMDYLSPRRGYGPYLPVRPPRGSPEADAREASLGTSESDSDDPDWEPNHNEREVLPSADQLLPDWAWLAAARTVADCVLHVYQESEDVDKLAAWDNLREGTWLSPPGSHTAEDDPSNISASLDGEEHMQQAGYDWAGAEGVWRRLTCWLGYDDLVYHHHYGRYDDPDLDQAWIIVPFSLRITGYSPSPIPKYADRPTIHVEGEMGGAEWEGSIDISNEDIRRVHGTVSMLSDGSVRWSITSMDEENADDQWASEAVQLGGVGSAMGALGMWTGVRHEVDDPLVPLPLNRSD